MNDLISKISNLFKKYGIKSLTMDDISRNLGISKKTLYQHFENKNDIMYQVAQFQLKNECDELDKLSDKTANAIEQLLISNKYILNNNRSINSSLIYCMNKYYPQIWIKYISQRKEYLLHCIKQNFQLGIKQGVYRKNLNIDIIAVYFTFLLDINVFEMFKDELNYELNKVFDTLFLFHIRGIATNEGIDYIEKQLNNIN